VLIIAPLERLDHRQAHRRGGSVKSVRGGRQLTHAWAEAAVAQTLAQASKLVASSAKTKRMYQPSVFGGPILWPIVAVLSLSRFDSRQIGRCAVLNTSGRERGRVQFSGASIE
jgi:hypothetical protein